MENEELKCQNASLGNQLNVMQANFNNLIQENAQKTNEFEKKSSENQIIKAKLNESEADLQQLSQAKQTLLVEYFTMKKEIECMREKIKEILTKSIKEYTTLDTEHKRLRSTSK